MPEKEGVHGLYQAVQDGTLSRGLAIKLDRLTEEQWDEMTAFVHSAFVQSAYAKDYAVVNADRLQTAFARLGYGPRMGQLLFDELTRGLDRA